MKKGNQPPNRRLHITGQVRGEEVSDLGEVPDNGNPDVTLQQSQAVLRSGGYKRGIRSTSHLCWQPSTS